MDGRSNKKLVVAVLLLLLQSLYLGAYDIKEDLAYLDKILDNSAEYLSQKESRLHRLELDVNSTNDLRRKYVLLNKVYEEYFSFQFDKALKVLDEQERVALELKDSELLTQTRLRRAKLYCVGGCYKESEQCVAGMDTSAFSKESLLLWYDMRQQFCYDFGGSGGVPKSGMLSQASYYRGRFLELCPQETFDYDYMFLLECMATQQFEEVRKIGLKLVNTYGPNTHEYAKAAYYLGVICEKNGDFEGLIHWYCESAKGDVFSAVKDNAALHSIALNLIGRKQQVERAFEYTQKALEDALYYNAALRVNHIIRTLPSIEATYFAQKEKTQKKIMAYFVLMVCLVSFLLFLLMLYVVNQHKLKKTLSALRSANRATEEFLGLFLSMSSSYLDKLRPFLGRSQMTEELKHFYNAFDTAVLQLYPDFVQDFNELLVPESRITLKKGEVLNTELRIFALIRFGVDQSSHIASLLRYSVNTIYNYRAQVKAGAKDTKTPFEEQVKQMGLYR
ncbi:MAG: DUF6377 domain-containing protein [Candidatus Cryptobacteroides sp.]